MCIKFICTARHGLLAAAIAFGSSMSCMLPAYADQDVTKYGAKGDGLTDDSDAIQKAINAAAADKSNNRVVFPDGEYLYTKPIIANGVMLLGSWVSAQLVSGNVGASIVLSGEKPVVSYLTFKTKAPGGSAIQCKNASFPRITNSLFEKGFSKDIDAQNWRSGSIDGNTFKISDFGQGISGSEMGSVWISKNVLFGDSESSVGMTIDLSVDCKVQGNMLKLVKNGMLLSSSRRCEVIDNQVIDSGVGLGITGGIQCSCTRNWIDVKTAGVILSVCQEVVVDTNTIKAGQSGILGKGGQSCAIKNNNVTAGRVGVAFERARNLQVENNYIHDMPGLGLEIRNGVTAMITRNTIFSVGNVGVLISDTSDSSLVKNRIYETQQQGIYELNCSGTDRIEDNKLGSCGRKVKDPAAVIFVDSPKAANIPVLRNDYVAAQRNLKYFIWTIQTPPTVNLSGNTTDTLLPNKTGR